MFSFRDLRMELKSPFRITIQFNFKVLLPKNSALELIIVPIITFHHKSTLNKITNSFSLELCHSTFNFLVITFHHKSILNKITNSFSLELCHSTFNF